VTELDIVLQRAPIQLEALIVTGTAGVTEKREIGNAVSSLDLSKIPAGTTHSVQEQLQSRVPGLTLLQNSGLVGTGSNVQIRGAGSLNANYGPVYYVDGTRFEAQPVSTGGVTNSTVQFSSPLDFIDPDDIERVEVIKGPAASTLYGADAAGGVIQIITKKGLREGSQWNEDGIFWNNFQNRTGGRANFEVTPTAKLNLGLNLSYTRVHHRLPLSDNASNGLLRNAFRGKARATADRWDAGYFGFGPDQSNEFDLQSFEERTTLGLTANFNPFPWLENRLILGMDKYDRRDQTFFRIDSTFKWGATEGTGEMT